MNLTAIFASLTISQLIMKASYKTGFSFGLTSAIITTLGLMVGLHSVVPSKLVVLGGILTIAVADAFSDALGIHIAEESKNEHTARYIWESTISTFLFKFIFALTFVVPIVFFDLEIAIYIAVIYGLILLGAFSYYIAKLQKIKPLIVVSEHLAIAVVVILTTHLLGDFIAGVFK